MSTFSNKIIPIRVEKTIPQRYKVIEWKIHNTCNYNCSFCASSNKDGSESWLTLDQYKVGIDKIAKACEGSPYYIIYTGGEPTLYPKFIELLKYSKSKGAFTILISNGARTLRWWKELVQENCLDRLTITYHSEQTDNYKHIADVMNLFHDMPTETCCEITHTRHTIDQAFNGFQYLIENTGGVMDIKGMNITDYNIYDMYTAEQLEFIKNNNYRRGINSGTKKTTSIPLVLRISSLLTITYDTGHRELVDLQSIFKNQKNSFTGWNCDVGKDFLRIVHDRVYRSVCEVTGVVGSLYDDNISFFNDTVICDKHRCVCFTDITATKIK